MPGAPDLALDRREDRRNTGTYAGAPGFLYYMKPIPGRHCLCSRPAVIKQSSGYVCDVCRGIQKRQRQFTRETIEAEKPIEKRTKNDRREVYLSPFDPSYNAYRVLSP